MHRDTLQIACVEGDTVGVQISARGVGTTMFCEESLELLDFKHQFTALKCTRRFLLENKGRRQQTLSWVNLTVRNAQAEQRKAELKAKQQALKDAENPKKRRKKKKDEKPKRISATFKVEPEQIILKPRTACYFTFVGLSNESGIFTENLVLESKVGKDQKSMVVFKSEVKANFITPLLQPSAREIDFHYTYDKHTELTVQRKPLELKNISKLPLEFTLRTQIPFDVDTYEFNLQPGEKATVNVEFDPGYKDDRMSHKVDTRLTAVYSQHPQKDHMELRGDINFPNLEFETQKVDFGCILNDTTKSMTLKVTNVSTIDCAFQWAFIEDEDAKRASATARRPYIPVNQVFDILPIRGYLKPGESETVEVMYYGHPNRIFKSMCVCEVEGGPEYEIKLRGEASDIGYEVSASSLTFGNVVFNKQEERDFFVVNTGKVPFSFRIKTEHISGPSLFTVHPTHGKVKDKDKQRVVVKFSPQVPIKVEEEIILEVAHFHPKPISMHGIGIFARVSVSLPMIEHDEWPQLLEAATVTIGEPPKPPTTHTSSPKPRTGRTTRTRRSKTASKLDLWQRKVENEAQRLYFMNHLLKTIEKYGPLRVVDLSQTSKKGKNGKRRRGPPPLTISRHFADFGNVIAGTTRKRNFRVTNTGEIPVSFSLDKRIPASKGFTIEPEKVTRLPEGMSVDFAIKFKAKKVLGDIEVEVPLDIKGGPLCSLSLRANVTVPDLHISPENLDFGTIVVGQCKVFTVQLTNISPVATEWQSKKITSGKMVKSSGRFDCQPTQGLLQPGQRQNVQVTFTPASDVVYVYKIPFRVKDNPAQKFLGCKGTGHQQRVTFEPPTVMLRPVLPFDPPIKQTVTITNNSSVPVEIYSLDFDTQYISDEEVLRNCSLFEESSILRLKPRVPGGELPVELLPSHMWPKDYFAQPFKRKYAVDFVIIAPPMFYGTRVAQLLANKYEIPSISAREIFETIELAEEAEEKAAALAEAALEAKDNEEHGKGKVKAKGKKTSKVKKHGEPAIDLEKMKHRFRQKAWTYLRKNDEKCRWGIVVCFDGKDVGPITSADAGAILAEILGQSNRLNAVQMTCTDEEFTGHLEALEKQVSQTEEDLSAISVRVGEIKEQFAQEQAAKSSVVADENTNSSVEADDGDVPPEMDLDVDSQADVMQLEHEPQMPLLDGRSLVEVEADVKQRAEDNEKLRENIAAAKEIVQATMQESLKNTLINLNAIDVADESAESKADSTETADKAEIKSDGEGAETKVAQEDEKAVNFAVVNCVSDASVLETEVFVPITEQLDVPEPGPRTELDVIPDPETLAIFRRPQVRLERPEILNFAIESFFDDKEEKEEAASIDDTQQYRWILQPGEERKIEIVFTAQNVGNYDSTLGFEIVGDNRTYSLLCHGVCTVPGINTDPRNVFMSRVKGGRPEFICKKYVVSRERFEFGPLLCGKKEDESGPMNTQVFRISNNSKFETHASLAFMAEKTQQLKVFSVNPNNILIAQGETAEIEVRALPDQPGEFLDNLICTLRDNPDPVQFTVFCIGASPQIELHGPWEKTDALVEETPVATSGKGKGKTDKNKSKESGKPVMDFDRLLLGVEAEQTFELVNVCTIPVAWRLDLGSIEGMQEFTVVPQQGVLEPEGKAYVTVAFNAINEQTFNPTINILYSDNEGGLDKADSGSIQQLGFNISAEAYKLSPSLTLETDEGRDDELVFGPIEVNRVVSKKVTIGNSGKYDVAYKFEFRRPAAEKFFSIEPTNGTIEPNSEAEVLISFQADKEVHIRNNVDIRCKIIEVKTGQVEEEFPVRVQAESVFSKYRLQPLRGINFGALKFGSTPRERNFELRNDGIFPYNYRISVLSEDSTHPPVDEAGQQPLLAVGPFSVEPSFGEIVPGQVQTIKAVFNAEGAQVCKQNLFIDMTNRDPATETSLVYELVGESCIPGINTDDFFSIFEEQEVLRKVPTGEYQRRAFAEEDGMFTFGAVVPSSYPEGLRERFKISNISKVQAKVHFAVKNKNGQDAGVFTVQPEVADLPPHEHRYISVYFKPTMMKTYNATFTAVVEDGKDPETGELKFDLYGEGTMPCASVTAPSTRSTRAEHNNALMIDFGRLQVGKSKTEDIVLKNDGVVASTITFQMEEHSDFRFPHGGQSVTLQPGMEQRVQIGFFPSFRHVDAPGGASHRLTVGVLNNKFSREVIVLSGKPYQEDVAFDNLPGGLLDELKFGDADLDNNEEGQQVAFTLRNQAPMVVKFKWAKHTDFKFSPSVGHLPVGGSKEITVTFKSSEKVEHKNTEVGLTCQRIVLESGEDVGAGWDDTQKTVSYRDNESGQKEQVTETIPEPKNRLVKAAETDRPAQSVTKLGCTARADHVSYECEASRTMLFSDTMMFQARVHSFTVQNTSGTSIDFVWEFTEESSSGIEGVPCPYDISPSQGSIPALSEQEFTVRFAPADAGIFSYTAFCNMLHLPSEVEALQLSLSGRALRPVCHFDLSPTDYLTRRNPNLPGPDGQLGTLDPAIRVVQMQSLGIKVKNTARFVAINPLNVSYEFIWEPLDTSHVFRCITPQGVILPGKRFEMAFEFSPVQMGLQESFWRFSIPSRRVSATFLIVGEVKDPRISLGRAHVNFRQLLIDAHATETVQLINEEHIPFAYAFDVSLFDQDGPNPIKVSPAKGVIGANSKIPIEITFTPQAEKEYNINLECNINNKPQKISLNIKGEGYTVHDSLVLKDDGGSSHDIVNISSDTVTEVDFGFVQVNSKVTKYVELSNTGKLHYDFVWGKIRGFPFIQINPSHGTVRKGDKVRCALSFEPLKECQASSIPLACTVAGARRYRMRVSGQGGKARVDFSFRQHDFGACFVGVANGKRHSKTATLRITNNEDYDDITIDCMHEKTPELEVLCEPMTLPPHASREVQLVFIPREAREYSMAVEFEINGLYRHVVLLKGEGTSLRLELANPSMQQVNLGSIKPGQDVTRTVRLINRSKQEATFELVEETAGALIDRNVSFWPSGPQLLAPRAGVNIDVRFTPQARIATFAERLLIQSEGGIPKPLLMVTGSCVGVEIHMDTDCIPFGKVCVNSRLTRKLRIENAGDVGTKFKWNTEAFEPHFSIMPSEGYMGPHSDMTLQVSFHPTVVDDDIRNENLRCFFEGIEPLNLTLTGACVEQPESNELTFESVVRKEVSQTIQIQNNGRKAWHLRPAFENSYFGGEQRLVIPPGKTGSYEVKYRPLTMTKLVIEEDSAQAIKGTKSKGAVEPEVPVEQDPHDGQRPAFHEGSVFFALPDGKALSWKLRGRAKAPDAEALPRNTKLSTPAKVNHIIPLLVKNWSNEAQKFDVEIIKQGDNNAAVFLRGGSIIGVPGAGEAQYKLNCLAYEVTEQPVQVRFSNPLNGEFIYYNFTVEFTKSQIFQTISLETMCRQSVRQIISIENPLPEKGPIVLQSEWWNCTSKEIRVKVLQEMSGAAETNIEVEFRPLVVRRDYSADLVVQCEGLGEYRFKLLLNSTEAGLERSIHFKAPLGGTQSKMFRFSSYLTSAAPKFTCKVGKPLFFAVNSDYTAEVAKSWEGSKNSVEVVFEPEELGEVKDVLTLSSKDGGEFKCTLFGECTPPLPQGPFTIKPGSKEALKLKFKNVFNQRKKFVYTVDHPAFAVNPTGNDVDSKATTDISVTFDPAKAPADSPSIITGRLLISCASAPDIPPWIYYLNGVSSS